MPMSIGPQNPGTLPGGNDSFEKSPAVPVKVKADQVGGEPKRGVPTRATQGSQAPAEASATHQGLLQATEGQDIVKPPSGN